MSELSSKLERREQTESTRAMATRAQLNKRWCRLLEDYGDTIRISAMSGIEVWRRIRGGGQEAMFEKAE